MRTRFNTFQSNKHRNSIWRLENFLYSNTNTARKLFSNNYYGWIMGFCSCYLSKNKWMRKVYIELGEYEPFKLFTANWIWPKIVTCILNDTTHVNFSYPLIFVWTVALHSNGERPLIFIALLLILPTVMNNVSFVH